MAHPIKELPPEVLCKKGVLRNFPKFTRKWLCQSLFFNKIAGLRLAVLLKKRLWHRRFLWILRYFEEHLFFKNASGCCFFLLLILSCNFWWKKTIAVTYTYFAYKPHYLQRGGFIYISSFFNNEKYDPVMYVNPIEYGFFASRVCLMGGRTQKWIQLPHPTPK